MVGRVGDDDFGQRLLNGLRQHKVNTNRVIVTEGVPSGIALILVDRKGENSIVVASGANRKLTPADVEAARDLIHRAAAVVIQLEIPLNTVRHAIALCRELGVFVILDPAPVPDRGAPAWMYQVDILTPNQTEAMALLGRGSRRFRKLPDNKQIASEFLDRGARAVVLKRGARGSVLAGRDVGFRTIKPFKCKVVDTTAAGDAFTGALAVAISEGHDLPTAARLASAAGALACKTFGAQPSLPTRAQLEAIL
jgi:ribokinase